MLCKCSLPRNVRSKQVYLFSPFSPAIKHFGDRLVKFVSIWKGLHFGRGCLFWYFDIVFIFEYEIETIGR